MVIFLFMAVSYMALINEKQSEKDQLIKDYQKSKIELLTEIRNEFKDDFKKTKWNAVLDSSDLSIKFIDERILFDVNKSDLKTEFQDILSDFFPRYLKIVLKPKYIDKIAEIRVEGHTSPEGDYIHNLELSQDRTTNVIKYLRNLKSYNQLDEVEKERLKYWLTANGLSSGRTLDYNGKLSYRSKLFPDYKKSRRVEFKIVTTSEELINKAIKKIK